MAMLVSCPSCNRRLRANDTMAGKRVSCPNCGGVVDIPRPSTTVTAMPIDIDPNDSPLHQQPSISADYPNAAASGGSAAQQAVGTSPVRGRISLKTATEAAIVLIALGMLVDFALLFYNLHVWSTRLNRPVFEALQVALPHRIPSLLESLGMLVFLCVLRSKQSG
jgi:hypothetical protein